METTQRSKGGHVTTFPQKKRKNQKETVIVLQRDKRGKTYNIATWNFRSMYEGKLNIVQKEMNRMDIDILGIREMKWLGIGHFRSANNTELYSGHNTHKMNGVGMIITNQMSVTYRL